VVAGSARYALVRRRCVRLGSILLGCIYHVADPESNGIVAVLLLIIVLILIFGLGGGYWGGTRWGPGGGAGVGLGTILLICLIVYLLGGFR